MSYSQKNIYKEIHIEIYKEIHIDVYTDVILEDLFMPVNLSSVLSQIKDSSSSKTPANVSNGASGVQGNINGAAVSDETQGLSVLKKLLAGDTFSGQVVSINDNTALLKLADGGFVSARLLSDTGIQAGQTLTFMVEENSQSGIAIKPLDISGQQSVFISKALEAAGLAESSDNINMVKELISLNMPVDAGTLGEMVKYSLNFPNTEASTIASLMRLGIAVNADNIAQFEAYKSYEHSILSDLNEMGKGLSDIFRDIIAYGNEALAADSVTGEKNILNQAELFSKVLDNLYSDGTGGQALNSRALSELFGSNELKELSATLKGLNLPDESRALAEKLSESVLDKNTTVREALQGFADILKNEPQAAAGLKTVLDTGVFDRLLGEMVNETLKLNPSDLTKEDGIKSYYKRIKDVLNKLSGDIASSDKAADLSKSMDSVKSNIDFMNDLNKNMTYFQIPVHFSESDANGELYVFTNKRALADTRDNISALLHLDMEHLGPVDIYVRLRGMNVSADFCLESEQLLDFVYANIDKLNKRLEALGYSTEYKMKLSEDSGRFDFVNDFVNRDITPQITSQYILDIKA